MTGTRKTATVSGRPILRTAEVSNSLHGKLTTFHPRQRGSTEQVPNLHGGTNSNC